MSLSTVRGEGDDDAVELVSVNVRAPSERVPDVVYPVAVSHIERGNFVADAADVEPAPQRQTASRTFRFPWYRAACAVTMLAVGVACGISSAVVLSLPLGIISVLLCLPGAYMTWTYFQVYRNNPGYTSDRWLGLEPIDS
jgi:hypothetical protein